MTDLGALVPSSAPGSAATGGGALLPIPTEVTGVTVTFQSLLADAGAPFGVSGTNPITVTVP